MTQDMATMRQHYTTRITTEPHILSFILQCQKGKEKKMKRDETEHSRKEVGDNVWRWGGQKEYEIDAKSLHWHGILTRKSTIKAYPYNTPQPSPCKQHQRKRKETWRAHIYIVVMSWSHTFVMCGVLPPFILITGRFRILLGSIIKVS